MNALFWRSAILAAAALSLGAGYRTQNFIVTTILPRWLGRLAMPPKPTAKIWPWNG